MGPRRPRALARGSGARFAFADCRPGLRDLRPLLGPLIERARSLRLRDALRPAADEAPRAAVRRRRARLRRRGDVRDPAQRRGADAAGGGADRRRPGALPRLLVVLPARAAGAARRAVGGARAVAADVEGRARARARARSRCSPGGWRGAAARPAGRRRSPGLAATFALAYPSGPHPFPVTLALCLGALLCLERPALAGALTGAAAFWRLEFAAYLMLGALLAYAVRDGGPRAAAALSPARRSGVAAVLFAPFVVIAGPGDAFELLVRYPLLDFGDYQSLPFPLDYDGPLNTGSPGGFLSDSAESLLLFYLPLALVLGLAGGLAARGAARSGARSGGASRWPCSRSGCCTTCSRAPTPSTRRPLAVMVAVLAAWAAPALSAATAAVAARPRRRWRSPGSASRSSRAPTAHGSLLRGGGVPLALPVADGVRVPAREARRARGDGARDPGARPAGRADLRGAAAQRPRHRRQPPALRARRPPEPDALRHPGPRGRDLRAGPARDRRRPASARGRAWSCATRRRSRPRASPTRPAAPAA